MNFGFNLISARHSEDKGFPLSYTLISLLVFFTLASFQVYYPLAKLCFIILVLWGGVALVFRFDRGQFIYSLRYAAPFVIYSVVTVVLELWQPQYELSATKLDTQLRFLYSLPLFYLLIKYRPSRDALWFGVSVGAILSGLYALSESINVVDGMIIVLERAKGTTYEILFGDLSLLFATLSLIAFKGFKESKKIESFIFILGVIFGVIGSILSASRGGWIAIPFVGIYLGYIYKEKWSLSLAKVFVWAFLFLLFAGLMVRQFSLEQRFIEPIETINKIADGKFVHGSTGDRIEMWRASLMLICESPWIGHGLGAYNSKVQELIAADKVAAPIGIHKEPHNDLLSVGVSRGAVGIISLLALYLCPIYRLSRDAKREHGGDHRVETAATATMIMYLVFGLTDTVTVDKLFIAMYIILMALMISLSSTEKSTNES